MACCPSEFLHVYLEMVNLLIRSYVLSLSISVYLHSFFLPVLCIYICLCVCTLPLPVCSHISLCMYTFSHISVHIYLCVCTFASIIYPCVTPCIYCHLSLHFGFLSKFFLFSLTLICPSGRKKRQICPQISADFLHFLVCQGLIMPPSSTDCFSFY